MSESILIFKSKLKQKGIFSLKQVYTHVFNALIDEDYRVHETKYVERVLKDGESRDVDIFWIAKRPMTGYISFKLKVDWQILGMKKVKVKKDGQDVTMESGLLEIKFYANLIKDEHNKWDKPIFKNLRRIYDKYIIKNRIEDYELKLYEHINDLMANAKAYLAIEGQHNSFY